MPELLQQFALGRCPHCRVDRPSLNSKASLQTTGIIGGSNRVWRVYACERCGGAVTAVASHDGGMAEQIYPETIDVDETLPSPAKEYLIQAMDSLAAPAGSVMLSASAVDAMLQAKGLIEGSLYTRIGEAAECHLITEGMAQWAHAVRLEANDPRHADLSNPLPSQEDAARSIDFVQALGQFLFVLPERVRRGHEQATGEELTND